MVVARLHVCLTPLVVTLTSSIMQAKTSAFFPLLLSAIFVRHTWRRYLDNRLRGTHLSQMESAVVTDPASPRPRRAISSPTFDSSSVDD